MAAVDEAADPTDALIVSDHSHPPPPQLPLNANTADPPAPPTHTHACSLMPKAAQLQSTEISLALSSAAGRAESCPCIDVVAAVVTDDLLSLLQQQLLDKDIHVYDACCLSPFN